MKSLLLLNLLATATRAHSATISIPTYDADADDAADADAADDADSALLSGQLYRTTAGARSVFQKP
jgi:hypothetical protein